MTGKACMGGVIGTMYRKLIAGAATSGSSVIRETKNGAPNHMMTAAAKPQIRQYR